MLLLFQAEVEVKEFMSEEHTFHEYIAMVERFEGLTHELQFKVAKVKYCIDTS